LQSGELENESARLQKARISIYSDRRHPSRIVLTLTPQFQCIMKERPASEG
jgi:hypothetical protein